MVYHAQIKTTIDKNTNKIRPYFVGLYHFIWICVEQQVKIREQCAISFMLAIAHDR